MFDCTEEIERQNKANLGDGGEIGPHELSKCFSESTNTTTTDLIDVGGRRLSKSMGDMSASQLPVICEDDSTTNTYNTFDLEKPRPMEIQDRLLASEKIKLLVTTHSMETPREPTELEKFLSRLEAAEKRRKTRMAKLDLRHNHIFENVAGYFNAYVNEIEESVHDEDDYVDLLVDLMRVGGRHVIFFYNLEDYGPSIESGRYSMDQPSDNRIRKVIVSDGTDCDLIGDCVYVYRLFTKEEVNIKTMSNDLCFGLIPIPENSNTAGAIKTVIINSLLPCLEKWSDWGDSQKPQHDSFIHGLQTALRFFESTEEDINNIVDFKVDVETYEKYLASFQIISNTSKQKNIMEKLNATYMQWLRQISGVIQEGKQVRYDPPDAGPLHELIYWRRMLRKYMSVTEFINDDVFTAFTYCLKISRSKILPKWRELDNDLTNAINVTSDNVKYLMSLERFWNPLYRYEPPDIIRNIPDLMSSIKFIYKSSTFYNTSDHMTSFLLKVTNQLTLACQKYLSGNGNIRPFDMDSRQLIEKINVCKELNNEYRVNYNRILGEIKTEPNSKPWHCSELYIFGKMNAFISRLDKIKDIIDITETYSILDKIRISGLMVYLNKIEDARNAIMKKDYNILAFRDKNFDNDYLIYKQSIARAEGGMQNFVKETCCPHITSISLLNYLKRFEKLSLPCLSLERRYLDAAKLLEREIEQVKDVYNEYRQNPPLDRCVPSTGGRILWIRSLFRKIDEPMQILKNKKCVITHRDCQLAVKYYNYLSGVLIHYEMLYHKGWFDYADEIRKKISLPVLLNEGNSIPKMNIHPYYKEFLLEIPMLLKQGFNVPDNAKIILFVQDYMYKMQIELQSLLARNKKLRENIPGSFVMLMRPLMIDIELAFKPGFSSITWTSQILQDYLKDIDDILFQYEHFLINTKDILLYRVEYLLEEVKSTLIFQVPDHPLPIDKFTEYCTQEVQDKRKYLTTLSSATEKAVCDIINTFCLYIQVADELNDGSRAYLITEKEKLTLNQNEISELIQSTDGNLPIDKFDWINFKSLGKPVTQPDNLHSLATKQWEDFRYDCRVLHRDCMDFYNLYYAMIQTAMIDCVKGTLEYFRTVTNLTNARAHLSQYKPLIVTKIYLKIPGCVIQPNVKEIQEQFDNILLKFRETCSPIKKWGNQAKSKNRLKLAPSKYELQSESDFSKLVTENSEIQKAMFSFEDGLLKLELPLEKLLGEIYDQWKFLWAATRDAEIEEFVESEPLVCEIKEKFEEYNSLSESINEIPKEYQLGALVLETDELVAAILVESNEWKFLLGQKLGRLYQDRLDEISLFIIDNLKVLNRPIFDLNDVGIAMNCLGKIRDNFIRIDMNLELITEVFSVFAHYNVDISVEEYEKAYGIRFNFQQLIKRAQEIQGTICEMQEPLLKELNEGLQSFEDDISKFENDYEEKGPLLPGLLAKEASDRVLLFHTRFEDLWERYGKYQSGQRLFGIQVTEYPILMKRHKEFVMLNRLYGLYLQVNHIVDGYYEKQFHDTDIDQINQQLSEFQNKCKRLPKGMRDWPAYIDLSTKINDFAECCPLLQLMTNPAMLPRHWKQLSEAISYEFRVEDPDFRLKHVMEAPLLSHKDIVEDICISAIREKDIEIKLKQVISDWSTVFLTFSNYKQRGDLLLKGSDVQEVIGTLEESMMVMNSLLSNRFNAHYKKEIQKWASNILKSSEVLELWLSVQSLWAYLEAVFVGGDIARQIPLEAKKFQNIDKTWVRIMSRAKHTPNVIECCTGDDTMSRLLPELLAQLEDCQKSLITYLESKRLIFPRFFFVSDSVLIEILGQSSNPHSIQGHLLSIFDAVARVEFDDKKAENITSICAAENEVITLSKPIACRRSVEHWLNELLDTMKDTIGDLISQMWWMSKEVEFNYVRDFPTFCGQISLLGIQLIWTREADKAIRRSKTNRMVMKNTNNKFLELLNDLIDMTTEDLTKIMRLRLETLITIHVHQRDIFDQMYRLKIRSVLDFNWQKQSRFYFNEESDVCTIKITDVEFNYQNEYLGVTERLVITPLTDQCYITLAQAIGMNMGGAPAGPAGTGKTETVKDMGRTLGKFVVVFNCSDQMDFRGLGRIFKGLAQSGCWGCFDEFNRIDLPVLSVAAQQIYIILTARKERKLKFIFSDGVETSLNREFGLFITMNPGYAGRNELPENLKIQFRSVSMMVPDRQIIIRVKLASCGFKENIILARKFFTLYKLCEEQLSKQVHYDFGLRNMLSVLRTLGAQKRANPRATEETTVMRVLRDMNLSKLIDEDEPLFMSLIEDLFPGIKLSKSVQRELQRAIAQAVQEMKIENHADWNLKVVQLYETSLVRHGFMALGPTGSGKTSCIHTLMNALTELGTPHLEMRMNPKAITASQMFGRLDASTNDWTDGIFSTLWRRCLKIEKSTVCWIVLDGPVDAIWIENLNSVLDDNKTLTLANGDRIVMATNSKLVFEPDNIDNASLATVSRLGMVFMSASVLGWKPIVNSWLQSKDSMIVSNLRRCFELIFNDALEYVITTLSTKMKILESVYIRQCLDILDGLFLIMKESGVYSGYIERMFLFSLMWSLGCALEVDQRIKFQQFLTKHPSKMKWPKISGNDTIFEYRLNEVGHWSHWNNFVAEYQYPIEFVPEFSTILVPNVDNTRTGFLIDLIVIQRKAVLLIGEQGTAKTVMIKDHLACFDPDEHLVRSFNFSSATTPTLVQRTIESFVEKRVGMVYGPSNHRAMSIFIDDVNMPVINEWGDQITNEILRQLMEYKGFYSLDRPGDFITIQDIQFLAAMIHPGGGRNDIPSRLKRRFNIFNCTLPGNESMDTIFGTICRGYFCSDRFDEVIVQFIPKLVSLTRQMWQRVKRKMLPTPAKFHYVFNLRDLSRIWEGMLRIQKNECKTIKTVLKLWKHEFNRVIADRFTNEKDKHWFSYTIKLLCERELIQEEFNEFEEDESYFVNFMRNAPELTGDEPEDFNITVPYIYEEIPNIDILKNRVYMFVNQYNEQIRSNKLDIVLFHDALVHLVVLTRITSVAKGHALLVGVGGSGKQTLAKLASFILEYKFHQIIVTRSYSNSNLLDDFKIAYLTAGKENKGINFIFTDNDIRDEGFLEYINNVLSSGEIANLFPRDEMEDITNSLIPEFRKERSKLPPTYDNLMTYFLGRAKRNLHMILSFSPVGPKFRSRALKFPGLISGCIIDWYHPWPKDALISVSSHYLNDFEMVATEYVKTGLIQVMGEIHDEVGRMCTSYFDRFRRLVSITPKTFLVFLDSYKKMYAAKRSQIEELDRKVSIGLVKLDEAATAVALLKGELTIKGQEIAQIATDAKDVLDFVAANADVAEKIKAEVLLVKEEAAEIVKMISAERKVAEEKLLKAKPALDEAEAALRTITSQDIATVRSLGKPPYLITVIMDVVLILFRARLDPVNADFDRKFIFPSWTEATKILSDSRFLNRLLNYPRDTINAEMIDHMKAYFNFAFYTFERAKIACGNVAGLINWTFAMAKFYEVNKDVMPLKLNLAKQQAKLDTAERELVEAELLLADKETELAKVQMLFDDAMNRKKAVQDEMDICQGKMDAAESLVSGLSGEKMRWIEQSKSFKMEVVRLAGDIVMLVMFLTYAGPFNQEYRTTLQTMARKYISKKDIPLSAHINLLENFCDAPTISEWNMQGLPNDELSIQNGVICTHAARYPLLIDPQSQGNTWIKNMEEKNKIQITCFNHRFFRNSLEEAVCLGHPLLIEDMLEDVDACLDNILDRNYIRMGTSYKVLIGDKEIDINGGFRLYLTTKLSNPNYSPEVSARTSVIDFAVTMKGLEDQLLGRVILSEKAELELERNKLIISVTENKRQMERLENELLYKLTTVEGNIIEDVGLLNTLTQTKRTATEVENELRISAEMNQKINEARDEFRSIAVRGSILYFIIVQMSMVNPMYQTSLNQFLERFDKSLKDSTENAITAKRIHNVIEYLTYEIFSYQVRGFYEQHKFLFVVLMALYIDLFANKINYEEFEFFIKGGAALDLNNLPVKPFKWITDVTWLNLYKLISMMPFKYIIDHIIENEKQWRAWFSKAEPESEPLPEPYSYMDTFKKLLVVRTWCLDRTIAQCKHYVMESLGYKFSQPMALDLQKLLDESKPLTPVICLLSMGSDPSPNIEQLAKKNLIKIANISMGQGQEVHARNLMQISLKDGSWVLLQNCHLSLDYMNELSVQLAELSTFNDSYNLQFRLWLTTEVHPNFPMTLLQQSLKFTNDPPLGLRAGLRQTYSQMHPDQLDFCDHEAYIKMVYAISVLHSVVQERRKYGPLGWNIPYEFNLSDWFASCTCIQNHLDSLEKRSISWVAVRYMISSIQYGGRVTDDYDNRLLQTFTKNWFSESLFEEGFEFHRGYPVLHYKQNAEYIRAFEDFPTNDPPQLFGLHPNANITYQTNTCQDILDTIISIQPKDAAVGSGETRESAVSQQATYMLDKLPPMYDYFEVRKRMELMGRLNPLNIFLRQEIDRMQKVLIMVRSTLFDLLLAIEGTIIMNDELQDALNKIYDARIPQIWIRPSWTSSTLGFWFTELVERNVQFSSWCFKGRPTMFWMTGFFNPQGFLTAMRQEVTRTHSGWALDQVSLHNDVLRVHADEVKGEPVEGVYVYGLYLEGAGWDKKRSNLVESISKMLYDVMPVIHIYAINQPAAKGPDMYQCPVYKKKQRTGLTFITPLMLKSVVPPDHWILRGVAILCDIK